MTTSDNSSHYTCYYSWYETEAVSDTCFIFIHGFASDATEWELICQNMATKKHCYALSLPGCFGSVYHDGFIPSANELSSILADFIAEIPHKKKILVGYSMGARLALYTTLHHSPAISGLILESGTAGIEDSEERNKRIEDDNGLANTIAPLTGEEFEKLWKSKEIFSSQEKCPPSILERLELRRTRSNPALLAEYLRYFGTGVMPGMWADLHKISVPVLLISGELDTKFTGIARKMAELIPDARHETVQFAGHNTHLENPADFLNLLFNFSNNL